MLPGDISTESAALIARGCRRGGKSQKDAAVAEMDAAVAHRTRPWWIPTGCGAHMDAAVRTSTPPSRKIAAAFEDMDGAVAHMQAAVVEMNAAVAQKTVPKWI